MQPQTLASKLHLARQDYEMKIFQMASHFFLFVNLAQYFHNLLFCETGMRKSVLGACITLVAGKGATVITRTEPSTSLLGDLWLF